MNDFKMKKQGYTLIELVCAVAIGAAIVLVLARLASRTMPFYRMTMIRQELMSQSTQTVNLIIQYLRQGKAGTLNIVTPTWLPIVPNSDITFDYASPPPSLAKSCRIYLQNGTVFAQDLATPTGDKTARPIATNVTGLMFTGSYADPALVGITLKVDKAWDPNITDHPERVSSILLPNRTARMNEAP